MLELWRMQSKPTLLSLIDPHWSGEVGPDRVLPIGQIKLFDIETGNKQMTYVKLNCLK